MTSATTSHAHPAHRALSRAAVLVAALALVTALAPVAGAQLPDPSEGPPSEPPSPPEEEEEPTNGEKGETRRLAGDGRFQTAAEVAADAFPAGAATVLLARGDDFPDALAGSYLAGVRDAPILLTSTDSVPEPTLAALESLVAESVVLLGGTNAISAAVETELEAEGFLVERIAGTGRYETARLIALAGEGTVGSFWDPERPGDGFSSGLPTAIVATGVSFADALAAGPFAFADNFPVVLTASNALVDDARSTLTNPDLGIQQVVIVGGTRAIGEAVEEQIAALENIENVIRVSGQDRTETAVLLAQRLSAPPPFPPNATSEWSHTELNLALGQNFPDALAVGPRGGRNRSAVLLSLTPSQLGTATSAYIQASCETVATIVLAGGEAVLSAEVEQAAGEAAVCTESSEFELQTASASLFGEEHEITVVARDELGRPVEGLAVQVDVYFGEVTDGQIHESFPPPPQEPPEDFNQLQPLRPSNEKFRGETDELGMFTASYTGPAEPEDPETVEGRGDRVEACIDPDPSGQGPFTCEHYEQGGRTDAYVWQNVAWASHGFRTALDGASVPDGDPEAEGSALIWFNPQGVDEDGEPLPPVLCFGVLIDGLDPTATDADIVKERPDGDVALVSLVPPPDNEGRTAGCAEDEHYLPGLRPSSVVNDILAKPAEYYVLIMNSEFPEGALRGDLA